MHWSYEIAKKIIERRPDKEEYVCAAGISPSGSVHIGNFRDVATSWFVVKALRKMGKKAKMLFSWDEYDRMRKVPANVAKVTEGFEKYIGCPYTAVPDPFGDGHATYAEHFEKEFEPAMEGFGVKMEYRHQSYMYENGMYTEQIIKSLRCRKEIFDILDSFRTQDAKEGERDAYMPVAIYCPVCGRDTTHITHLSDDCTKAHYVCDCGHEADFDFRKDHHCKLAWKVDWAMRWAYEGVDFEPGGKDHAAPTGSYQTSRVISREIFGYEAPLFVGYEFIGIKGTTGKMSSSSGLNLTPGSLLKIYDPEIILWLYAKTEPAKAFDFCFDDGILRQYFEFDRMYKDWQDGRTDEFVNVVMDDCLIEGRRPETVPMSLLVQFGSIVDFNIPMLEKVFEKVGTPYKQKDFAERLPKAEYWLENCSPESVNRLRATRNFEVYDSLSDQEKAEIARLYEVLSAGGYDLDGLQTLLYAIPKETLPENIGDKELKAAQGVFFKNVYRLLIDKERGPRLYLFLYAIDKESYMKLLDFSFPKTEEEKAIEAAAAEEEAAKNAPAAKTVEYGDPDPVEPVKAQIGIDAFGTIDLRVAKVIKCQEIRKSHSCYKITLFDGEGERVIVSSIKAYYTPEELIGKKLIVVANLAPARIAGVESNGMLLAGTNNACGCKIVFVDDMVPEGTMIK